MSPSSLSKVTRSVVPQTRFLFHTFKMTIKRVLARAQCSSAFPHGRLESVHAGSWHRDLL